MRKILFELIVLLGIGGLIWAAFAYFVNLPENPSLISRKTEVEIGEKVREAIIRTNSFTLLYSKESDQILQGVADSIFAADSTAGSISIEIIRSEMANAFALPGGYIIVTTGLIDLCENAEEFIAVVCHETGHVVNRDVLNRMISTMGLELLLSSDPFVTGEVAKTLLNTGYSRSQEKNADLFSCEMMVKLGLEPRALSSILRRMKEENPNPIYENVELISTHPATDNRIKEILLFVPPAGFEKKEAWFDWEAFQKSVRNISEEITD